MRSVHIPVLTRNLPVRRTASQAGRSPALQASPLLWNVVGVEEDSFRSARLRLVLLPCLACGRPQLSQINTT